MADAAIIIGQALLILVNRCVRLMAMLVVTKMPNGSRRGFVLTIACRARPGKLERQGERKKNQENPLHRRSIAHQPVRAGVMADTTKKRA